MADLLTATVALPFPARERAILGLRGQLRALRDDQHSPAGPTRLLDWETLTVGGPEVVVDPDGRSWFTYSAHVATRALPSPG